MKKFKKEDYSLFDKKSKYTRFKYFRMFMKKNDEDGLAIGLIITKKTGNAVYRNRIRRIVYEFFRKNEAKLKNFKYLIIIDSKKIDRLDLENCLMENLSNYLSN